MAQEVYISGATYSAVPGIRLPDSNGNYHEFSDASVTTAVESDVGVGKIFLLADGTQATGTGSGTPSATQHTIYFEFSDETDTTITAYYDSSFISDAIRATTPTEYGGKTVDSASIDGVAWYTRPTETWETIYDGSGNLEAADPYPYFWISELSDVVIPQNSVWRITFDGTEYICTATQTIESYGYTIGNPLYSGEADDGSGVPLNLYRSPWGAWSGGADASAGSHTLKIERQVLS